MPTETLAWSFVWSFAPSRQFTTTLLILLPKGMKTTLKDLRNVSDVLSPANKLTSSCLNGSTDFHRPWRPNGTDPKAWYAKCFSQVAAKPISSCLRHCLTLPDHGPWEMPDGYGMARHGPDQLSSNILKPLIDTYRHSRCVRWYKSMMSMVTYRRIRRPYSRPGPIVSGHHQPSQWICLCSLVQGADGVHQWNFWGFECLMVLSAIAWEQVFSMPK